MASYGIRITHSCEGGRRPQGDSSIFIIGIDARGGANAGQFEAAFSSVGKAQALYVVEDPIFFAHRATLLKMAATARLPTVHELRRFPEQSALMSYGPDLHDLFRRSAIYVDRILKGAKPAEIPVEQPTKFEFVVTLTTAKMLGLDIPPALLSLADDLIE